jgi:hypothetical protein
MAQTRTDLGTAITNLIAAATAAISDSTAAFGRLKNLDYTPEITQLNTQITALQGLSTTAKAQ